MFCNLEPRFASHTQISNPTFPLYGCHTQPTVLEPYDKIQEIAFSSVEMLFKCTNLGNQFRLGLRTSKCLLIKPNIRNGRLIVDSDNNGNAATQEVPIIGPPAKMLAPSQQLIVPPPSEQQNGQPGPEEMSVKVCRPISYMGHLTP